MQTEKKVNLKEYQSLIETIAKVEFQKLSATSIGVEYLELVNIGTHTLYLLFKNNSPDNFNHSYLSTAIKWAIRNEVRRRFKWYSIKRKKDAFAGPDEIREAMYKTILSIDEMAEAEVPKEIASPTKTPDEMVEFFQLKTKVMEVLKTLPPREKEFIEQKFFEDKKLREISEEYQISQSRISRIIQSGLNRIKKEIMEKEKV